MKSIVVLVSLVRAGIQLAKAIINVCFRVYCSGHLAATYSALCCLLILGDDLSQVKVSQLVTGLTNCQLDNGCFGPTAEGGECDMRYVFCAAAVSYILNDWRGFDKEKALGFIESCMNFDGGIGQAPGLESHGGSVYCALASLHLMGEEYVDRAMKSGKRKSLQRWCLMRQNQGFSGRPDKPSDSCYTFWIGASLKMVNILGRSSGENLRSFVLSTQDSMLGGFAKYAQSQPDVLHTYLSLAGLSLLGEPGIQPVNCCLNISVRASKWLIKLQKSTADKHS